MKNNMPRDPLDRQRVNMELRNGVRRHEWDRVLVAVINGADPNMGDGLLPLHEAISSQRLDIAEALVHLGADPNWLGLASTVSVNMPPIGVAALLQNNDAVNLLLNLGANPSIADACYRTPLSLAIEKRAHDVASTLLDHGVDVNQMCRSGRTAMHCAVNSGDADIVKLLIEHGADLECRDDEQRSPRDLASSQEMRLALRARHSAREPEK